MKPNTLKLSLAALSLTGLLAATPTLAQTTPEPATPTTQPATRPASTPVLGDNTILHPDVPYGGPDAQMDVMDIYSPKGAKDAVIVLFVHGGEWSRGDKKDISFKPRFFNGHNIIFASMNYRLSPQNVHPSQVDDVAQGIAFLTRHAADFGGSPDKIVIMGHSAGCHLVSLVSLDPQYLAKVGLKPSAIKATVAWSGGMYDLPTRYAAGGMYQPFIKATFGEDEKSQRAASPIAHVGNSKDAPPILFASIDDPKSAASRDAAENMVKLVNANGGNAQSVLLENRAHFYANYLIGAPDDTTGQILLNFIASKVK